MSHDHALSEPGPETARVFDVDVPAATARICKGCWQQMHLPVPLRGPLSLPLRLFGIRPSRMNPNTCTICEMMFTRIKKARSIYIDATVLFADLRGYSALSQRLAPDQVAQILDSFYDVCGEAIWRHDGLLNKTIGDAVMAVFNFPIRRPDHAKQAVLAAREIQQRCAERQDRLRNETASDVNFSVGVGIDTGKTSFGEFGHTQRDYTAIGTVVNLASRAQGVAAPGEILVTSAVRENAVSLVQETSATSYELKGFDEPVVLYSGAAST